MDVGDEYLYNANVHEKKAAIDMENNPPYYTIEYDRHDYKRTKRRNKKRFIIVAIVVGVILALGAITGVIVYLMRPKEVVYIAAAAQSDVTDETAQMTTTGKLPRLMTDAIHPPTTSTQTTTFYSESTTLAVTEPKEMLLHMTAGVVFMTSGTVYITCNITNAVPLKKIIISKVGGANTGVKALYYNPTPDNNGFIERQLKYTAVTCSNEGQYRCAASTKSGLTVASNDATLTVRAMPNQPTIELPTEVVVGKPIKIMCSAIADSPEAQISWATRGPSDSVFYRIASSGQNFTSVHCLEYLTSSLEYTPRTNSNGNNALVRCTVNNELTEGQFQTEKELQAIPETFCDDKGSGRFEHPYGPCYLAVQCTNGEPSVIDACPDRENDDVCYNPRNFFRQCS